MTYVNTFGGQPQNPSQVSLNILALTADVELSWPWSGAATSNVLAKIMRVSAAIAGWNIDLPTATQASSGEASLFINTGANSFNVNDADGGNITSVAGGTAKFVYLITNTTDAGSWGVFTFGTGSSGADASALAGAGLLALANTLNEQFTVTDSAVTPSTVNSASRAIIYNWTGGAGVLNVADTATLGTGWFSGVRNTGSGALVVTPATGTIDGASTKTFNPGDAAFIIRSGANLITVGFGQSAAFSFDYIAINVAGTGDFTLNSSQQNRISYKFTGLLTGDRTIIVPATTQQYWVDNATTGAFNFYVKTLAQAGAGIAVATGARDIFYCNGSDVVDAVTGGGVATPVAIADGGTGATTASGARTSLGATAVGDALFTAATAAAARASLVLGTMATQDASAVAITGGTMAGITAFQLISTDAGATEQPTSDNFRNSASPAASDLLGGYVFNGNDSGANKTAYVRLQAKINDPTNGSEDGQLNIRTIQAGTEVTAVAVALGVQVGAAPTGGDKGAGTVNLATQLYLNNSAKLPTTDGTAGQVLTSSGGAGAPTWGSGVGTTCFSVTKSGAQSGIASGTGTQVTFDTEEFDVGNYYDTATNRYTPPAGTYLFTAGVNFLGGVVANSTYSVAIRRSAVGGDLKRNTIAAAASATDTNPFFSALLTASGTDYFEIWCIGNGAGAKTIISGPNTFFQAVRVA